MALMGLGDPMRSLPLSPTSITAGAGNLHSISSGALAPSLLLFRTLEQFTEHWGLLSRRVERVVFPSAFVSDLRVLFTAHVAVGLESAREALQFLKSHQ